MGEESGIPCGVGHKCEGKRLACELDPLHDGDHLAELDATTTIMWSWSAGQRDREETRWMKWLEMDARRRPA